MLTDIGRYGSLGPSIVFRLEDTGELLWHSSMSLIPREGDLLGCFHLEGETVYKVESVKFEFNHDEGEELDRKYFGTCVFVSEVT